MRRAALRVKRVVAAVRRENGSARIYLLGLYNPYRAAWLEPHIARWDSRLIASFADVPGVTVIRVADLLDQPRMLSPIDHFHPSAAGYRAVAERVAAGWR
jgi:lysophospholipase L1-like esterase